MKKREIKLMAWDGNSFYNPIFYNGKIFRNDRDYEDSISADDDEIMEFIGEQDKNGLDIYSGHIVDVCIFLVSPSNPDNDQHFRGEVVFENGSFNLWIYQYYDYSYSKGNLVKLKEKHIPFECELDEYGGVTVPLYEFMCMSGNMGEWISDNITIVGNIYQNKELLPDKTLDSTPQ